MTLYESDGAIWHTIASGGGSSGGGIQFGGTEETPTYGPDNSGDFLHIITGGGDDGPSFGGVKCGILLTNAGDDDAQLAIVNDTDAGIAMWDTGLGGIEIHATGSGDVGDLKFICTGGETLIHHSGGGGGIVLQNDGGSSIDINDSTGNGINLNESGGGVVAVNLTGASLFAITGIPTSNPGGSGNVWSNGGVLNIT